MIFTGRRSAPVLHGQSSGEVKAEHGVHFRNLLKCGRQRTPMQRRRSYIIIRTTSAHAITHRWSLQGMHGPPRDSHAGWRGEVDAKH